MKNSNTIQKPFTTASVAAVFDAYPKKMRARLITLRNMIFEMASKVEGAGEVEETKKRERDAAKTSFQNFC